MVCALLSHDGIPSRVNVSPCVDGQKSAAFQFRYLSGKGACIFFRMKNKADMGAAFAIQTVVCNGGQARVFAHFCQGSFVPAHAVQHFVDALELCVENGTRDFRGSEIQSGKLFIWTVFVGVPVIRTTICGH